MSINRRYLELLAPAKNVQAGKIAIDCGADAVYIGAPQFGARQAAVNTLGDIHELCTYAHRFGARVYVTVNTLVYDEEMQALDQLLNGLAAAETDAVLVQDMAVLERLRHFPQIEAHASTQADCRTAEKAAWLHAQGFQRVVLARELCLDEIRQIAKSVPCVELEAFVHGALCVSYSGQCYASQYCFQRSANRGECAQFCRMKFDLLDANGTEIVHQRHLLSLRDMCRVDDIEALAAAGVTSFKIEGRLKDETYVANTVAVYRQKIDQLIAQNPAQYACASIGKSKYAFKPDLQKIFNRGYTDYFMHRRTNDIHSFYTPKAIGEKVGVVKEIHKEMLIVAGTTVFTNGDGLCFFNPQRELEGFRVNRADKNRLYPHHMPENLKVGTPLFRNAHAQKDGKINAQSAQRRIAIDMLLDISGNELQLTMKLAETAISTTGTMPIDGQKARIPQHDNMVAQLKRLGDTEFAANSIQISDRAQELFVPSSQLGELRRITATRLRDALRQHWKEQRRKPAPQTDKDIPPAQANPKIYGQYTYLYNIANQDAARFYRRQGLSTFQPAFERQPAPKKPVLLMQCRHCLRYSLGFCKKNGGKHPTWQEPLSLRLGDGRLFQLQFDCRQCQMNIFSSF